MIARTAVQTNQTSKLNVLSTHVPFQWQCGWNGGQTNQSWIEAALICWVSVSQYGTTVPVPLYRGIREIVTKFVKVTFVTQN